jgi:hypothetical protein
MTLNRYLLVGKVHHEWLVTVAKLDFKWVIRGSILASALINIGHGWQYQAVTSMDSIQFAYTTVNTYGSINGISYSDYPQANQGNLFFIFSIVYFVFNFGVFFYFKHDLRSEDRPLLAKRVEREERAAGKNELS